MVEPAAVHLPPSAPIEYARDKGLDLRVLYDRPDELNPMYITCPDARPCANPKGFSPGTPRHPAYPSGHSTYSGAASTVLAYFFDNDDTPAFLAPGAPPSKIGDELRAMADNIGMGRMWAGIHWRSDHEAGLKLGQVVGCLVLRQLAGICGGEFQLCPPMGRSRPQCRCDDGIPCRDDAPTPCNVLKRRAANCVRKCAEAAAVKLQPPCGGPVRAAADADATPEQLDQRSVQQGGATEQ